MVLLKDKIRNREKRIKHISRNTSLAIRDKKQKKLVLKKEVITFDQTGRKRETI